jgi:1,2-diacylglycerol 3-alpha-glucosyltransferase
MTIAPLVAVCFQRLGPYHHARLSAAGARTPLAAIEFSAVDKTYAWAKIEDAQRFGRTVLFEDALDAVARSHLLRRVHDALGGLEPDAVAIPGWSEPAALAALLWCLRRRRPAVLMADSTAWDELRRPGREAVKRRVVRLFGAATVGGAPHRDYACALGLSRDRVFCGYDVVDNDHFARGAERARAKAEAWRGRLRLPERFFLACSRLIEKKNLFRLLEAYALYRGRAESRHWRLVILGDGHLRPQLTRRVEQLGIAEDVLLPGFKQYDELPAWYGLAGAFVHASTTEQWGLVVNEAMASGLPVLVSERCGCAPDLVEPGVNGFTFDPYDVDQLAGLMQRIAAMTEERRRAMGRAGQRIIAAWGPERFADGLMQAVEAATCRPPPASRFDQALLWALARRPL